ncbi:MAG: UDP-N-acetylglucosamine 1-carboxyvinyltransferase [Parcubacteria group bacterium Gr01-1014_13]|nr:MAG: UDP-N-acetylglucosamine 1-carboxyvinyltransferase [Parcubacteria group bacterium Gr01-1014_13]
MTYLVVNGGKKLHGEIMNQPAKNSAVSILCASIMIPGKTILSDVPQIEEVNRILELLTSLGVKVEKLGPGKLSLESGKNLNLGNIDKHASEVTRSSLLLLGALSSRPVSYKIYKSGGCRLGERTVRPHLYALQSFGVSVISKQKFYEVKNSPLRAAQIVMYESGDTPTENAIMAAVLAPGKSIIRMASANYMVQDLCYFLRQAGAKIEGIGTTTLTIEGVKELKTSVSYSIMPDPIAAMTFLSAAIVTGSHLTIKNCPMDFLDLELCKLEKMGQKLQVKNERDGKFRMADIEVWPSALKALPDKIYGRPFPGLNIDNLPLFIPVLAKAKGRTLVHDWAYENRSVYSMELQKLGAKINLLDLHRAWVEGPTQFKANEVVCPPALRPAVNVLICMLAAKGKSILRNTYVIDRGYENLYDILNSAGADIKIVKE